MKNYAHKFDNLDEMDHFLERHNLSTCTQEDTDDMDTHIFIKGIGSKMNNLLNHLLLSHFSHVRLCDPRDGSSPGFPVPGILQARILEWVAISFSNA